MWLDGVWKLVRMGEGEKMMSGGRWGESGDKRR